MPIKGGFNDNKTKEAVLNFKEPNRLPPSIDAIKDAINLQCLAKFKPRRVNIPAGWNPKNSYERNLAILLARHDPRFLKMTNVEVVSVLKWAG